MASMRSRSRYLLLYVGFIAVKMWLQNGTTMCFFFAKIRTHLTDTNANLKDLEWPKEKLN